MRDLENRLAGWRRAAAAAFPGRDDVIDELEGHLRDDLRRRLAAGEPADDAWAAALVRLGSPAALAAEFARAAGQVWAPARLAPRVLVVLGSGLAGFLLARQTPPLLAAHVWAVTVGYCGTALVACVAACYLLARPFGGPAAGAEPALRRSAGRTLAVATALTAVGVFLGGVWARENLGRFWGWDVKEVGGLLVLVWGTFGLWALRSRLFAAAPAMQVAVMGNAAVALAWFGADALARGVTPPAVVPAVAAAQLVILAVGFVPRGRLRAGRA